MDKKIQKNRNVESYILFFFSIYNLNMFVDSIKRGWEIWVSSFIILSLVVCLFVHIGKYKDYRFRAFCVTIMIQFSLCIYGMNVELLYNLFPYMCALIVLTGLYGIVELPGIFNISIWFLFFYHCVISGTLPYGTWQEVFKIVCQLLNMMCIVIMVYMWLKEREKRNLELLKSIEELQEAERSKDDFLANISHEIRTPINTICGMSESVLQQNNLEKIKEDVNYIQSAGRNLMSVVGDILVFSELESGKLAMEQETYNITSTINDIINMTLAKVKDKNVELVVDCDATIPCGLQGDEKKIRKVIMNLVDNAIKFTKDGCVGIQISWRKEEYGMNLIVTIEDTGIGMKEESIEKIFQSFSQVDVKRNRQNGGVGLGLAISKSIVQMMGGVINIKSKFGKGTKVKFVVPQKVVDDRPIASLKNREDISIAVYIDMEQFSMMEIRDQYSSNIRHMVEQMQVRCHMCRNLPELKRRADFEKFSHVFISLVEYKEDKAYFDALALKTKVIIILYRSDEKEIKNPNFIHLYKPFYILPIVSLLNGEFGEKGKVCFQNKGKMTAPRAHVLIIDDNFMNLKVMESILKKYHIKISTAMSGKEALEIINKKCFDLVFMDHMMPEMDGVETFHRIRQKGGVYFEKVPIVALTANAIAGAREMFLEEGFNDFLEKPVENSVLQRVLLRNLPEDKICQSSTMENQEVEYEDNKKIEIQEKTDIQAKKQIEETTENAPLAEENTIQKEPSKAVSPLFAEKETQRKEEPAEAAKEVLEEAPKEKQKESTLQIGDLDVQKGILYCDGEQNYLTILKLTCDTAEANRLRVQQLFEQEEWKEYVIMVHGIKSSMFTIGALQLSEQAKQLELEGKKDNIEYIRANHEAMLVEYERVMHMLLTHPLVGGETEQVENKESVEPTETTETKKQVQQLDSQQFEQFLEELEAAMYDFNEAKMLEILTQLQGYEYCGTSLEKPLNVVVRKVKMSDYMSAVDKVVKLKEFLEQEKKGDNQSC